QARGTGGVGARVGEAGVRVELDAEWTEKRRRLHPSADQHAVASRDVAVCQGHGPVVGDRRDLASLDVNPPRQGAQRTADAQAATERIDQSVLPWRRDEWDSRRDLAPVEPGEHATGLLHRRGGALARTRGDEALDAEQPPRAQLRLPPLPSGAGLQRERAQLRAPVRDAEDPTQSRGLLGERLAALEHDRALPAPRQLVGGREPAHTRADDDNHAGNCLGRITASPNPARSGSIARNPASGNTSHHIERSATPACSSTTVGTAHSTSYGNVMARDDTPPSS